MKKSLQERLNASLDKALDPPRKRPKQELDALLDEYDDGQSSARRGYSSRSAIPRDPPKGIPTAQKVYQQYPVPNGDIKEESPRAAKKTRRPIA